MQEQCSSFSRSSLTARRNGFTAIIKKICGDHLLQHWQPSLNCVERNSCWVLSGEFSVTQTPPPPLQIRQNYTHPHVAEPVKTYLETFDYNALFTIHYLLNYHLRSIPHGLSEHHFTKNHVHSWMKLRDETFSRRDSRIMGKSGFQQWKIVSIKQNVPFFYNKYPILIEMRRRLVFPVFHKCLYICRWQNVPLY